MADNYTYYDLVTSTGVVVPDTAVLRQDVAAEYKRIFGADLDVSPETPQGRLIEVNALNRSNTIMLNALMANQINPDVATGVFLDAIAALTDCYRVKATKSTVTGTLTGAAGTVIPAGARARTMAGDIFYLENAVTLPLSGVGTGIFLSRADGSVAAPAGSLNSIADGILGWETVHNDTAAVLGADEQSDRDLRIQRRRTLFTGAAYLGALQSAVWRVPNVKGVLALDNNSGETVTKDNVSLKPHSIYVAVYGGEDDAIALALYKTKTVGADYNGNTVVAIRESENGREYAVTFNRPTVINIKVEITIEAVTPASDLTQSVQDAIAAYEAGLITNIEGLNIGVDVSPFELGAAIVSQISGVLVRNVRIAKIEDELAIANIEIHADEIARIPAASVVVNVV